MKKLKKNIIFTIIVLGLIILGYFLYLFLPVNDAQFTKGSCFKERISEAIVVVNDIKNGKYYYTVFMFGMVAEESKDIEEFEQEDMMLIDCDTGEVI